MKALIIVDVQKDFSDTGSLPVKGAFKIINHINYLINKYKENNWLIIATKDFHPLKHISFASRHKKEVFDIIKVPYGSQQLWPDHCIQYTNGAEFISTLNDKYIDKIILKGTNIDVDSYSGFFENDNKTSTELNLYLQKNNIDELLIVGLALDYCLAYTAIDAAKLKYKVIIDLKGTKAINPNIDELLIKFNNIGITVVNKD